MFQFARYPSYTYVFSIGCPALNAALVLKNTITSFSLNELFPFKAQKLY